MIEIYLFVNPVGARCLAAEKRILSLINTYEPQTQLQLIPMINLRTVSMVLNYLKIPQKNIHMRNKLTNVIYSASLDVKTAQLQGKKRGRDFLFRLQEEVGEKRVPYSPELATRLFAEIGGNVEMFLEDRTSDFVKETFLSDQKIACEMNIHSHPSAVIYNYSSGYDVGIRVEGCDAIQHIANTYQTTDGLRGFLQTQQENRILRPKLSLV